MGIYSASVDNNVMQEMGSNIKRMLGTFNQHAGLDAGLGGAIG